MFDIIIRLDQLVDKYPFVGHYAAGWRYMYIGSMDSRWKRNLSLSLFPANDYQKAIIGSYFDINVSR